MRLHLSLRSWQLGGTLLAVFLGLGVLPSAVADEADSSLLVYRPDTQDARDPREFLAQLRPPAARAVVPLTRCDAVAELIFRYTHSMSERDVLLTAEALCAEGDRLGIDPFYLLAVMYIESFYNHLAVSVAGAEGLMQVMPGTAQWTAQRENLAWAEGRSFDPVLNVRLGARYLAYLGTQFDDPAHVLTAYNRGPSATRYLLWRHGELPDDVRDFYATKVLDRYELLCTDRLLINQISCAR